jgi:uncharacterized FlaG/YvyC family protein
MINRLLLKLNEVIAMRIDSMGAYQAGQKSEQKARPEVRELKHADASTGASKRSVRFSKHQGAERWMVQVVDVYNNEIIREIPNRKMLDVVGELKSQLGKMQDVLC